MKLLRVPSAKRHPRAYAAVPALARAPPRILLGSSRSNPPPHVQRPPGACQVSQFLEFGLPERFSFPKKTGELDCFDGLVSQNSLGSNLCGSWTASLVLMVSFLLDRNNRAP